MLTLAEVLHEQRALDRLCADRALQSVELFEWNAFYGHADVLKAAAGMPADRPLFVTLPHGVTFGGQPNAAEAGAAVATAYSYQREYDEALSRGGRRAVIRGAAPFAHVRHLVPAPPAQRDGVLFFPSHSTRFTTAEAEYDRMAQELAALPASLGPVRVCCYYMDILRGHHLPFLERGLSVYSAGHQYDPRFLVRLWHLLTMHAHVFSNSYGSHLPYALFSGCSFTYWPIGTVNNRADAGYEDWCVPTPPVFAEMLSRQFPAGVTRSDLASRLAAVDLIGAHRELSREQLRGCLDAAERRAHVYSAASAI